MFDKKFEIRTKLVDLCEKEKIAGMSVAITDRSEVIFAQGFGFDSVERPNIPTTPDSIYRIASITKVITGITVLRLAEEGILNIDEPVKNYVPWLTLTRPEALEEMTLRHLLSHTSGLPKEYTPNGPRDESALEKSLKDELPSLEIHSLPSENKFLYSNWGIRLVSHIAEIKTGRKYSELAYNYVINPLGMDKTTFDLHVAATYPMSLPHEDMPDGSHRVSHYIPENAARLATGGLYSNALDLCKLARFLMNGRSDNGDVILSEEGLLEMRKMQARYSEGENGYGLALQLFKHGDRYLFGHLGSAPPYSSAMIVDKDSGYGVALLMNTSRDSLRYPISEMLLDGAESLRI